MSAPRTTTHDVIIGAGSGPFVSYGPRVEHGDSVAPPSPGESPHYWSAYAWHAQGEEWQWLADCVNPQVALLLACAVAGTGDVYAMPASWTGVQS